MSETVIDGVVVCDTRDPDCDDYSCPLWFHEEGKEHPDDVCVSVVQCSSSSYAVEIVAGTDMYVEQGGRKYDQDYYDVMIAGMDELGIADIRRLALLLNAAADYLEGEGSGDQ